ncbi:reelin domain-containing protein 1-like [Erpetoichthys calabaricus]|uniref:reelin domain-containing protein 1-like n=1 Tax=Erpetoichthys calabaricus TaxID=27687 RepID=UPI002233E9D5|nr:reelin domain-containing protein 1-like [Erpetoichthys calabaricus]
MWQPQTPNQRQMNMKVSQQMKPTAMAIMWAGIAFSVMSCTSGFSHGANPSACIDMKPRHIQVGPQHPHKSSITLRTDRTTYLPGQTVTVTVRSTRDFMGFLIQGRRVTDNQIVGSFIVFPSESKLLQCQKSGDSVTHSDKSLKRNLFFVWKAPALSVGDIQFYVSIVQSYFIYWARINSTVVRDVTPKGTTPAALQNGQFSTSGDWTANSSLTRTTEAISDAGHNEASLFEEDTQENNEEKLRAAATQQKQSLTEPLDHFMQTRAGGKSTAGELERCHGCREDAQARSSKDVTDVSRSWSETFLLPTSWPQVETSSVVTSQLHQHQATMADNPSPALKQSVLVTLKASADFLQQTEKGEPREQKAGRDRNKSLGAESRPTHEDGTSSKEGGNLARGSHLGAVELGILLGCSAGLGMAMAAGLRYLRAQYCRKRTEVSFTEQNNGIIHVQESGELVQVRKVRENSFVLVQAEYNVITPPGK